MWIVHIAFAVLGLLVVFLGYWLPYTMEDGSSGLIKGLFYKTANLLVGGFCAWYGMYMLGWRLVQVAS